MKLRIKDIMDERGITQMDLANEIKVPQGTISRWSNNYVNSYNREILEKLMAYFDCDLDDLFDVQVTFEAED